MFRSLVMQPITLCQLDCKYCYLPDRKLNHQMDLSMIDNVIAHLLSVPKLYFEETLSIFWHGGEPLLRGLGFYQEVIQKFKRVASVHGIQVHHCIQTNGVLIDNEWCNFFKREDVFVGISIDGKQEMNTERVFFNGSQAWPKIAAGLEVLKRNQIPFATISVISQKSEIEYDSLFNFLKETGSVQIGINFQERLDKSSQSTNVDTKEFWNHFVNSWLQNPSVPLREVIRVYQVITDESKVVYNPYHDFSDLFLGVSHDGSISLLSPEFIDTKQNRYGTIVGNIYHNSFIEIINSANNGEFQYVNDYLLGKEECKRTCPYFSICGGGMASNKFFETGSCNATKTKYCEGIIINVADALIEKVG